MSDSSSTEYDPTFYHPGVVQLDQRFELRIEDVPSDEPVTLCARLDDKNGVTWTSRAVYDVEDGIIAVERDEPVDGTFSNPDTMALIQTMVPEDGTDPYLIDDDTVLEFEVRADGTRLGTSELLRTYGDPAVTVTKIEEHFDGLLYEPPGDEPAPGVVTFHGTSGTPMYETSRMLASNGFVVLALHWFTFSEHATASVPNNVVEIPVEYAVDAVEWLLDHERTAGSQVGAVGVSKGPELALLAATQTDGIGAVVSLGGSAVVWEGFGLEVPGSCSSWTIDGEPVPYLPFRDDLEWDMEPPMDLWSNYTKSYEAATPERIDEATIPVEEIDGPLLFISGADDALWDAKRFCKPAIDRLDERGHPYEYEQLVLEDAGHAVTVPYQPTANRTDGLWTFGGTASGYANADEVFWRRTTETLRSITE
ncbi:acyl-CoA thioester hydrolase/BAAT C-terminal domain-containing protein [Halopiger goleimassiliensis]|uniref:acyl-CoA thioester hydrolase/BAAT C-terminal domain-containing protein n=1 Tax=Halopiger goleimassiliensis TaxID=1293048 RepID=UPI0018A828A2|nr:acyl-CoA thioester hydrolase/BAAT C-terminal domain-containing protein [Halopiger goleimassiliensis]